MKKHAIISALLLSISTLGFAQTWTHFYNFDMGQRTVEPDPGTGEYVMTETAFDPTGATDNKIHFTHYDQSGVIILPHDILFDERGVDDRNVDITAITGTNKFLITSYYSRIGSGIMEVSNMLVDDAGTVLVSSTVLRSTDPTYRNLYVADAVFDPSFNRFVICGMASKGDFKDIMPKVAFVATVDPNTLSVLNMRFYDSNPGVPFNTDYDIANRIVLNSTGRYYITGSENVNKGGANFMGIRNMLIDPTTLAINWSVPISFNNTFSNENSVDMVENVGAGSGNEFFTLVNSTNGKWHFLRINPSTGLVINPYIETIFSYKGWGYHIDKGNNPDELVISGMKYRESQGNCFAQDQEATPFMATIKVSTALATLVSHVEYNTVVSNSPYWNIGEFYDPSTGYYPVPVYMNNFADREFPTAKYSVVTPIKGTSGQINTKYLNVDPFTVNGCDDLNCSYGIDYNDVPMYPFPAISTPPATWLMHSGRIAPRAIHSNGDLDCGSGYYRQENTTSVNDLKGAELAIYPNPATDKVSVELNNSYTDKDIQITLCDMTGKKIATLYNGTHSSNILVISLPDNITTGIYLLQVNSAGNTLVSKKLTINK